MASLGEPALFLDYGETLLYENGDLYDLHGAVSDRACAQPLEKLSVRILDHAAGIEYGWHHLSGCDCPVCFESRAA